MVRYIIAFFIVFFAFKLQNTNGKNGKQRIHRDTAERATF